VLSVSEPSTRSKAMTLLQLELTFEKLPRTPSLHDLLLIRSEILLSSGLDSTILPPRPNFMAQSQQISGSSSSYPISALEWIAILSGGNWDTVEPRNIEVPPVHMEYVSKQSSGRSIFTRYYSRWAHGRTTLICAFQSLNSSNSF
jgi:hypothetical protein